MQLNLQTLTGILTRGDELVAMLLAPNATAQRIRIEAIASDPQKLGELCHVVNCLRDHLRILALDTVEVQR